MKASELVAIWNQNGANPSSNNYTREGLKYEDAETGTTPEHIMLSERYERENLPFTPPPTTCTSCRVDGARSEEDWVYGHRPFWYVCDQCKTVLPCRCNTPDENGFCTKCGRMMSDEAILKYKEENCQPPAHSEDTPSVQGQKISIACATCNWTLPTVFPLFSAEYQMMKAHAECFHAQPEKVRFHLHGNPERSVQFAGEFRYAGEIDALPSWGLYNWCENGEEPICPSPEGTDSLWK